MQRKNSLAVCFLSATGRRNGMKMDACVSHLRSSSDTFFCQCTDTPIHTQSDTISMAFFLCVIRAIASHEWRHELKAKISFIVVSPIRSLYYTKHTKDCPQAMGRNWKKNAIRIKTQMQFDPNNENQFRVNFSAKCACHSFLILISV